MRGVIIGEKIGGGDFWKTEGSLLEGEKFKRGWGCFSKCKKIKNHIVC